MSLREKRSVEVNVALMKKKLENGQIIAKGDQNLILLLFGHLVGFGLKQGVANRVSCMGIQFFPAQSQGFCIVFAPIWGHQGFEFATPALNL